jgi:hypothetical protein
MENKKEEEPKKENKNQTQKKHEKIKKDSPKDHKDNKDIKNKSKDNKNNTTEKNKSKTEFKICFSSYGYIKIDKSEIDKSETVVPFIQYRPPPFKYEECLKGTIYKLNCFKEINIQIKTFYNQRAIHNINNIDIYSKLHFAVQRMFKKEEKEKERKVNNDNNNNKNKEKKELDNEDNEAEERITEQSQYRIFSCHKKIHELNPMRNIIENEIQDNEILLYLPIKKLSFSEYMKGYSVILSQEGKIASKIDTDDPQYVLGNIPYSFGKHYFEVNLLTEPIARSVIIGLATKRNPSDMFIHDVHNFYG